MILANFKGKRIRFKDCTNTKQSNTDFQKEFWPSITLNPARETIWKKSVLCSRGKSKNGVTWGIWIGRWFNLFKKGGSFTRKSAIFWSVFSPLWDITPLPLLLVTMRDLGRFTFYIAQRKTRIMPMKSGGGRGKERYALKVYGQQCFHSVASDILPSQVILHERQQKNRHACPFI